MRIRRHGRGTAGPPPNSKGPDLIQWRLLRGAGFDAKKPKGSFFLYVPAPKAARLKGARVAFKNAEEAMEWLLTQRMISTVPWDEACAHLRFSVTYSANGPEDEKRVMAELSRRLGEVEFEF